MVNFVTAPVLMEWFRKGALTRGLFYTGLNVIVCNILQENKNKYYIYLFASQI